MSAPQVYKAISKLQSLIATTGLAKTRNNQQQGYKFRGIDELYNLVAVQMPLSGLVCVPRVVEYTTEEGTTKNGGRMEYARVLMEFDFIAIEDGSTHTARTVGEAMDSADKALNKAMSAATKYVYLITFTVPTEGDNDADEHSPEMAPKPKTDNPAAILQLTAEQWNQVKTTCGTKDTANESLREAIAAGCTTAQQAIDYITNGEIPKSA